MGEDRTGSDGYGLGEGLLALLSLCAVVVTGLVIHREVGAKSPESIRAEAVKPQEVTGWRSLSDVGRVLGSSTATVEVVVFADYQCPACRRLSSMFRALRAEFPGGILYVHRHFPLGAHPHARKAAHAAECAAAQDRFAAMNRVLYREQTVMGKVRWTYFAKIANVPDLDQFQECLAGDLPTSIQRDRRAGKRFGVEGTPTLIIEGQRFDGTPPYRLLHDIVRRHLARR